MTNQRNGPEKLEFDEALQEAFTKFVTGEIDELEVEGFLRERFTEMQATELVIKQGSSLTIPVDVSKGSFEDMQNNEKHSLFQVHQVLVEIQDLQKIWQEELTSLTARVSIQFILLQRQKMERHMILIDSEYKAQDVTIR